ncbi:MAG: hypothetical protein LBR75_05770, partial [Prevotellaceae bacterium]|jgi:uncharacterized membrane protein|nr:hypothetical protein [Prevotellaceae bacterium]
LREQLINGVIAACVAIFGLLQVQFYLHRTMGGNLTDMMLYVSLLTLTAGVIITVLAAYFAAKRYLMQRNIDLYHS